MEIALYPWIETTITIRILGKEATQECSVPLTEIVYTSTCADTYPSTTAKLSLQIRNASHS